MIASGKAGFDVSAGFAANGYGAHSPGGYSLLAALVTEVVMTMMFLLIILGATDKRAPQGFAPIAIGLGLTLIHLISIPVTNTSVNPARSTGVAAVRRRLGDRAAVAVLGCADRRRAPRRGGLPADRRREGLIGGVFPHDRQSTGARGGARVRRAGTGPHLRPRTPCSLGPGPPRHPSICGWLNSWARRCSGLAFLNWVQRHTLVGGIYGRPLLLANLMFVTIAFFASARVWLDLGGRLIAVATVVLGLFVLAFGRSLFRTPAAVTPASTPKA